MPWIPSADLTGSTDEQAAQFIARLNAAIEDVRTTDAIAGIVLHHYFFGSGHAAARQRAAKDEAGCPESTPRNVESTALIQLAGCLLEEPRDEGALDAVDEDSSLKDIVQALADVPRLDATRLTSLVPVEQELRRVLVHSYRKLRSLTDATTFFVYMSTLRLRTLHYDPNDTLWILAKRDEPTDIEDDAEWSYYEDWMSERVAQGEHINHVRVVVRPSQVPASDVTDRLKDYHSPGTLFSTSTERVSSRHRLLSDFKFGLAISTAHRLAMISIPPAPVTQPYRLDPELGALRQLIHSCAPYDYTTGPMQAIVTAHPPHVDRLVSAFTSLLSDAPHTQPIGT